MKNLIVGNWKMNPQTQAEAKKLLEGVKKGIKQIKNTEVVVCPPLLYLPLLKGLSLGSQNCSWEENGAFTGEVSALMIKNLKINYIILGHSERRKYFIETDEIVNKKIKKALSVGLKIIFCVGETAEEKDAGKKSEVLEKQLKEGLKGISKEDVKKIVIAYEPVWSIGTGNNCSVNETMSSVLYIRKVIAGIYNRQTTDNIKIIYGGSVKSENSGAYIKETGVSGLLVGGASLNAEEFIKIIKSAE
ncbi:MAG: triose-phosphate isomerase [bacterium]|nr:triose-phosphate isomerase [bacterium]